MQESGLMDLYYQDNETMLICFVFLVSVFTPKTVSFVGILCTTIYKQAVFWACKIFVCFVFLNFRQSCIFQRNLWLKRVNKVITRWCLLKINNALNNVRLGFQKHFNRI